MGNVNRQYIVDSTEWIKKKYLEIGIQDFLKTKRLLQYKKNLKHIQSVLLKKCKDLLNMAEKSGMYSFL